ncbi:hypothetical protein DSM3645_12106 [Blastopirellula marina DSM 3645]|uniref:Uncharacterized protein n=1 Tax=Blastopirellula marina DSM 3645 TaxID=314230 RepID=A3ZRJ1_9BACT|nr:hypothetical protein DSM3645_12106 [Blastopirellula marina DSM 3645]
MTRRLFSETGRIEREAYSEKTADKPRESDLE